MCLGRWYHKAPYFILVLVRLDGAVCLLHDLCPGVWSRGHTEHLYGGIPASFLRVHVNDNMDWSREFMPRRISRYFLVCCIWWRLDMDFFCVTGPLSGVWCFLCVGLHELSNCMPFVSNETSPAIEIHALSNKTKIFTFCRGRRLKPEAQQFNAKNKHQLHD